MKEIEVEHQCKKRKFSNDTISQDKIEQDVGAFLFRPPVTDEELEIIATKMKSRIDDVYNEITSIGVEEYKKRKISKFSEKGEMDSDDERKMSEREKEKAAALEDAVVRGDPRRYQLALFELAKKQNTIVNLGTGQGKTLIALLVIKHFANAFEDGKQALFLVPSVALATQHTTTLQANLPYTVGTAFHNSNKSPGFREEMAKMNILVATHGAARDLFFHYGDLFSFDRINLLIIDECHYACGSHPYVSILSNFYHKIPKDNRPRVLGLTASPLVNVKSNVDDEKLGTMLRELEERLDSKLSCLGNIRNIVDSSNDENDLEHNERLAEERCVHYHRANGYESLPDYENIGLHTSRLKEFRQIHDLYNELGPKLVSIYTTTVAREISINSYAEESKDQFLRAKKYLVEVTTFCANLSSKCPNAGVSEKLAVLEQLLENMIESCTGAGNVGVVFVNRRMTALALCDYFRTRKAKLEDKNWKRITSTQYCRNIDNADVEFAPSIISHLTQDRVDFTNNQYQRISSTSNILEAETINDVLESVLPEDIHMREIVDLDPSPIDIFNRNDCEITGSGSKIINCDVIVRDATSVFKYLDQSHHYNNEKNDSNWLHTKKPVKEVLDGLRSGRTDVLIATSIVEEGVDIDACSFVIAFDSIQTTKAYVQMKGRARRKHAKFFVFQDTSTDAISSPFINLHAAQLSNLRINRYIESRPEYTSQIENVSTRYKPYCEVLRKSEEAALKIGEYRTSKALVDLSNAKTLLNRYTLSVPLDATRSIKDSIGLHLPQFEENRLILPSVIPSASRYIDLPSEYHSRPKREKRNLLSLLACIRLRKLNLLNERLLPLSRKDIQEKLISSGMTELATSSNPVIKTSSSVLTPKNVIYVYEIVQRGQTFQQHNEVLGGTCRSLCLITPMPFAWTSSMNFRHLDLGTVAIDLRDLGKMRIDVEKRELCEKFFTTIMNERWQDESDATAFLYSKDKNENAIIPPYIVGILTSDKILDYDRMQNIIKEHGRSEEERTEAVVNNTKVPRILNSRLDQCERYISYGSSERDAVSFFISEHEEYSKSEKSQGSGMIYNCQKSHHLPNSFWRKGLKNISNAKINTNTSKDIVSQPQHRQDDEEFLCSGLDPVLLSIDDCLEAPIADASLFLQCVLLPQILFQIERVMTCHAFIDHCVENLPLLGGYLMEIGKDSLDDIVASITAKSTQLDDNYEKLEYLGDAILKQIHTDVLLHSKSLRTWISYLHEGDLSSLRSAMGSNARLMHAAKSSGIDRYIIQQQLGRGIWKPSSFEVQQFPRNDIERASNTANKSTVKKNAADLIESLLGLIYLKVSIQAAYQVANEMGITLEKNEESNSIEGRTKNENKNLATFCQRFLNGYNFRHYDLLEEALTHPTCTHEQVPCYQRLEWVGDAILCLFTRDLLYKKFPELSVGTLVTLEATIVCNETLAYICASNGFHKFLNHRDVGLPRKFEEFERDFRNKGLWETNPPKCLSDIVESVVGSVFVDSGLESALQVASHILNPVVQSVRKTLIGSGISKRTWDLLHPKQFLNEHLGGMLKVKSSQSVSYKNRKNIFPIWSGGSFLKTRENYEYDRSYVASLTAFGADIIGLQENSSQVARNKMCSIVKSLSQKHPDVFHKLEEIKVLFQYSKEEEAVHDREYTQDRKL